MRPTPSPDAPQLPAAPPHPALAVLSQMRQAVRLEKAAVVSSLGELARQPVVALGEGLRELDEPGAYPYVFECTAERPIPEGTRVTVEVPGHQRSPGETLDHDLDTRMLRLLLRDDLGEHLRSAHLSFDPSGLLDALDLRLEGIEKSLGGTSAPEEPEAGAILAAARALALLTGHAKQGPPASFQRDGLSPVQQQAIGFVLGQEIAFLWGPPGTGKTQTVACLVHELVDLGERVLLAAHTNVATDNALDRVVRARRLRRGDVVRVGPVARELKPLDVGMDEVVEHALRASPDKIREIDHLCRDVARASRRETPALVSGPLARRLRAARDALVERPPDELGMSGPEALDLAKRAAELVGALEAIERDVVANAKVVATTLTRLYTSRLLFDLKVETLLIDEASAAALPQTFVAGMLATRRAVAIGDFMQLPPICQAAQPQARRWLATHAFSSAGCDRAVDTPALRVMLGEQWRMPPSIAQVVSALFYGGKLRNHPSLESRPAGPAMLLLDTAGLGPRTEKTASGSKVNRLHAQIVQDLVKRAHRQRIAVIAPYRGQVRAIRDAIRTSEPQRLSGFIPQVDVFTVHRYQGREKPLVILDLVEAPGTGCHLLNELKTPEAPNLLNVAISRASEKLVVVGHFAHLAAAIGRGALANRLLAQMRMAGAWELRAGSHADEAMLEQFFERGPA